MQRVQVLQARCSTAAGGGVVCFVLWWYSTCLGRLIRKSATYAGELGGLDHASLCLMSAPPFRQGRCLDAAAAFRQSLGAGHRAGFLCPRHVLFAAAAASIEQRLETESFFHRPAQTLSLSLVLRHGGGRGQIACCRQNGGGSCWRFAFVTLLRWCVRYHYRLVADCS